jgi:hypothetical protein
LLAVTSKASEYACQKTADPFSPYQIFHYGTFDG